jgi:hypothetical protein
MKEIQESLAEEFGLVYKGLYFVEYKDPSYPCNCRCHTPGEFTIMHCMPCCYDGSYKRVLRYSGVYKCSKGKYFLFTDPDPIHIDHPAFPPNDRDIDFTGMDVQYSKVLERTVFFTRLGCYKITVHRRAWDKLPKDRHDPKDFPIDFSSKVYIE